GLFINNRWAAPSADTYLTSSNPATGAELAQIAAGGAAEVGAAVSAARAAFATWSTASGHERARHLYALARGIQKHQRLLAVLESLDNGKPIRESRDLDVPLVARHFYHHAGWAQLMAAELPGYTPLGVVGQVIPWNFPLLMLAWKVAPALALGNTVVVKPAPYTPLTALLFAEIAAEAGLPPGVINIVTGGDQTGAAVVEHPGFDKIAFTGSTEVGRIIRRATAGTGKRLSLELGGKSPFLVFDDADQDAAIEGLVDAIWFNQGQVCCAGSRLLIQESIAEPFLEKLRLRMRSLRVGDSLDKGIDIGAIVDPVQRERIDSWVQRGLAEGGQIFQPDTPLPTDGGCWYPPTLLTDVHPAAEVVQEEIFGPVLVALPFRTPGEGVRLANNTRYGLAASVWSENLNLALDVAGQIKAGVIWVNSTNLFDAAAGFGGYRESGYGREGGKEGLYEYVRPAWQTRRQPLADAQPNGTPPAPRESAWGAHTPDRPAPLGDTDTPNGAHSPTNGLPHIDRTAKLYIGGTQKRPDGNYSRTIPGADGQIIGVASDGNRKDIRDAVEAADKASGWARKTGHARAQILYYIAENLSARADEFAARLAAMTGSSGAAEVSAAIDRLFTYAAYADKYGGSIQETVLRGMVLAVNEPVGVIGIVCPDDAPLLSFVSLLAPAMARGNTSIIVPSERYPLAATDFYQILETSDVPAGVVNIVTGARDHLAKTLVEHDVVQAMWYFGDAAGSAEIEARSAHNLKRTWVSYGQPRDWFDAEQGAGAEFLHAATEVKNIWVPTGE
ncbi:MAG: aldehyde dehydrogenase family protein, partial [Chloroflexi bacterium]|nr:aldehyde dehydrogenase family protein [Chloroflexota bacterium]